MASAADQPRKSRWIEWLIAHRTSSRLAFIFRTSTMVLGALLSLWWTRLFVSILGSTAYGQLLSFQGLTRLFSLGDFGITGALGLRTGRMLGSGDEAGLQRLLAVARPLFFGLSLAIGLGFAALSPWLPGWFGFEQIPGTGSLTLLFVFGGVLITATFLCGYFQTLNCGYGSVMWSILPLFFLGQLTIAVQWLVVRGGAPLYALIAITAVSTIFQGALSWWLVHVSHPWLGRLTPFAYDRGIALDLLAASGWVSLYTLGSVVFTATDRLLINAAIGPDAVPPYLFNNKICELTTQVILAASAASQARINLWLSDPLPEVRQRGRTEIERLGLFQSALGGSAGVLYLVVNTLFIHYWVGDAYTIPDYVQWAFALNLAITASGDASIQMAGICGPNGLRAAGSAIGATALLNLILSAVAAYGGSVAGVAYATVLAQSILSIVLGWYLCSRLEIPFRRWFLRSWGYPVAAVLIAAALHRAIGSHTLPAAGLLLLPVLIIVIVHLRVTGITLAFIRSELAIVRGLLPR